MVCVCECQALYAKKVQHNPVRGLGQPDFHSWKALFTFTSKECPATDMQAALHA